MDFNLNQYHEILRFPDGSCAYSDSSEDDCRSESGSDSLSPSCLGGSIWSSDQKLLAGSIQLPSFVVQVSIEAGLQRRGRRVEIADNVEKMISQKATLRGKPPDRFQ